MIAPEFEMRQGKMWWGFAADEAAIEITPVIVHKVMAGPQRLGMHNFVFMGRE